MLEIVEVDGDEFLSTDIDEDEIEVDDDTLEASELLASFGLADDNVLWLLLLMFCEFC